MSDMPEVTFVYDPSVLKDYRAEILVKDIFELTELIYTEYLEQRHEVVQMPVSTLIDYLGYMNKLQTYYIKEIEDHGKENEQRPGDRTPDHGEQLLSDKHRRQGTRNSQNPGSGKRDI